jgi:SHS2 domain-containing protein
VYETFEHTADVGLRVVAPDLNDLFVDAGRGLMAQLVEDPESVGSDRVERIEITAERLDELLFDWLGELLYRFDANRFVPSRFDLEVSEGVVKARVEGGTFDPSLHRGLSEVKAITYHGLKLIETPEGYLAEVILDI